MHAWNHTLRRIGLGILLAVGGTTAGASAQPEDRPASLELDSPLDATPVDLSGRWAQLQIMSAISEVPVIGDVKTRTSALTIWDVERRGDEFEIRETVCDIRIKADTEKVRTVIPKAFQRATSGATYRAKVTEKGDKLRFSRSRKVRAYGLANGFPAAKPLPEDEESEWIRDTDGDGLPGVTVRVEGIIEGSIYLVQRDANRLTGTIRGTNEIRGAVDWTLEQHVLGSDHFLLGSPPPSRPVRKESFFIARRVDAAATCEEVQANVRRLLKP